MKTFYIVSIIVFVIAMWTTLLYFHEEFISLILTVSLTLYAKELVQDLIKQEE